MIYNRTDPKGIDVLINRIQDTITPILTDKWGTIDAYGRVYKKYHDDSIRLERYIGNNEYAPVLFSEGNKIFFIQGDNPSNNLGVIQNDLWLACVMNINNVDNQGQRADEEAHFDVINALGAVVENENIIGLEYGMDNLKRVVEDVFDIGNFKYADIHPYHVFMVKLKAEYYLSNYAC